MPFNNFSIRCLMTRIAVSKLIQGHSQCILLGALVYYLVNGDKNYYLLHKSVVMLSVFPHQQPSDSAEANLGVQQFNSVLMVSICR